MSLPRMLGRVWLSPIVEVQMEPRRTQMLVQVREQKEQGQAVAQQQLPMCY
jgi:hypothetical protein